jgi:site-specific recombinase XerD
MLDKFFTQGKVRTRMENGPMGSYLTEIATILLRQRYSRETISRRLRIADQFGVWLLEQGVSFADVSPAVVDRYLEGLGRQFRPSYPQGRLPRKALGLRQLIELLRQEGILRSETDPEPLIGVERLLADFDHHLKHVAGNVPKTRTNYVRYARRFLTERFETAEPDWSGVNATLITEFVRKEAAKLQPSCCGQPVTAMRSFLRYLVTRGVAPAGIEGAVPPVRTWRHSSIPRHISPAEVEQVLKVCNQATPLGLRERAIVILLSHLGLRAGEVIRLKLEDIDWTEGRLIIRVGKNHRERSLPLSQEVGDALVAYLQKARPTTQCGELFLRWHPPYRPLRSSGTISTLVGRVLKRANVKVRRPGAHILRHTLATSMARQGVAFKAIADVLGHRALASTGIYAKLDLGSLSKVAMPWPGGDL